MRKAAFLDRDGTIIRDVGYAHRASQIEWVTGALEGMRALEQHGFALVIITNQSGVARGYFDEPTMHAFHAELRMRLEDEGISILDILHCPHLPGAPMADYAVLCGCRKPKPGMLFSAAARHEIDLESSLLVGDAERDIEAGCAAGVQGIMIEDCWEPVLEHLAQHSTATKSR